MEDTLLDKIISSQDSHKKSEINPKELVNFLLQDLTSREKEVVSARYGLEKGKKETLESIGKKFSITRERVRQIENNAIKKAVETKGVSDKLADLKAVVGKILKRNGHLRHENLLLDEILESNGDGDIDRNCLRFIFQNFLKDYIEPVKVVNTESAWKTKDYELKHYEPLIAGIKNILTSKDEPLHLDDLLKDLKDSLTDELKSILAEFEDLGKVVNSCLEVSDHFNRNLFDKWGMKVWRSITPKRMRDKIHLILLKYKEPLHYKRIAEKINEEKFDNKKAHPATIHNELILDDRFVLIGRGIYALKEWGYRPGVLSDVIVDIMREEGKPMSKDEIVDRVMDIRKVKEGSVNLTLSNKEKFEKLDNGLYALRLNA